MDSIESTATDSKRRSPAEKLPIRGRKAEPTPHVLNMQQGALKGALPENILTLLAFDVEAIRSILGRGLRATHFESDVYRRLADECIRYYKKYGTAPRDHLPDLVEDRLISKKRSQVRMYTDALYDIKALSQSINRDFVLDQLGDFIEQQELKRTVIDMAESIQRNDVAEARECLRKGLERANATKGDMGPLPRIVSAQELRREKFEGVRDMINPILPDPGILLIIGQFGAGKTQVGLGLGNSVSIGEDFLGFTIPKARSVLYMDAELPRNVLQLRDRAIGPRGKRGRSRLLSYWSAANCYPAPIPNLADLSQIGPLVDACDPFDVVFVDPITAMIRGVDLNTAEAWEGPLQFAMRRRHAGKSTVLIQHLGKDKTRGPRGSSRQEDFVDTSLILEKVAGSHGDSAVRMKCRKLRNHPESDFTPIEIEFVQKGDRLCFEHKNLQESRSELVAKEYRRLLEQNLIKRGTQAKLVKRFRLDKGTVSKIASKVTRQFREEKK